MNELAVENVDEPPPTRAVPIGWTQAEPPASLLRPSALPMAAQPRFSLYAMFCTTPGA